MNAPLHGSSVGDPQTVLIRVSGPDRPGINAGLMAVLDTCDASVQDIEQIVIRGQISLGVVVDVPAGRDLLRNVLLWGWEERIEVDVEVVPPTPTPSTPGLVVTVLGPNVTPGEFGAVTRAIADIGANIDRIVRLSRYPVMSYELLVRTSEEAEAASCAPHGSGRRARSRRRHSARGARSAGQTPRRTRRRLHPHPGRSDRASRRRGGLSCRGESDDRRRDGRRARF